FKSAVRRRSVPPHDEAIAYALASSSRPSLAGLAACLQQPANPVFGDAAYPAAHPRRGDAAMQTHQTHPASHTPAARFGALPAFALGLMLTLAACQGSGERQQSTAIAGAEPEQTRPLPAPPAPPPPASPSR